jgi:hypothetical protein
MARLAMSPRNSSVPGTATYALLLRDSLLLSAKCALSVR